VSRGGISRSNLAGPDALERFCTARYAEVAAAGLRDTAALRISNSARIRKIPRPQVWRKCCGWDSRAPTAIEPILYSDLTQPAGSSLPARDEAENLGALASCPPSAMLLWRTNRRGQSRREPFFSGARVAGARPSPGAAMFSKQAA
jgi:hypothetical protein